MRLLLRLAERAGEIVSIDDLLDNVWPGVVVTPDSVYQAVASLRRQLGDDPKQPAYIVTVPRLGYRMVATVSRWADEPTALAVNLPAAPAGSQTTVDDSPSTHPWKTGALLATGVALSLALVGAFLFHGKGPIQGATAIAAVAPQARISVAVLPFLDLTDQDMTHEYFADGMTEELIHKLSKVPGLQVPAPTASFYFKDKQLTIAQIANSLLVNYVLDGSVRKSGDRLRVAARLIQADNGFVVWSENYDRPSDDILWVQEDIAGEVAKALSGAIDQAVTSNRRMLPGS